MTQSITFVGGETSGPNTTVTSSQPPKFSVELEGYLPIADRQVVTSDGYAETGDGGAAQFLWNLSYSGPSTPLHIVPTGGPGGAWDQILHDSRVNVKTCGASGTGETDDTPSIQTAINLCGPYLTYNGSLSRFALPPGYYNITRPLFIQANNVSGEGDSAEAIGIANVGSYVYQGSYYGPHFVIAAPAPNPTYQEFAGVWGVLFKTSAAPYEGAFEECEVRFSEIPANNISGWSSVTLQGRVAPSEATSGTYSCVLGSAGTAFEGMSSSSLYVLLDGDAGASGPSIAVKLTTTDGVVFLDSTGGNPGLASPNPGLVTCPQGSMTHWEVDYDGSYVYLFVGGALCSKKALTGTIVQEWYETFCLGVYYEQAWPANQATLNTSTEYYLGGFAISTTALHTADFTPPTGALDTDFFFLNFDPEFTTGLNDATGKPLTGWLNGSLHGAPAWYRFHGTAGIYQLNNRLSDIAIGGAPSQGVLTQLALYGAIDRCSFLTNSGITWDLFSYGNTSRDCLFAMTGTPEPSGFQWCVGQLSGSQFCSIINPQFTQNGGWLYVTTQSAYLEHWYAELSGLGGIYANGAGGTQPSLIGNEVYLDAAVGNTTVSPLVVAHFDVVDLKGGSVAPQNAVASVPCAILDNNVDVDIDTLVFPSNPATPGMFRFVSPAIRPVRFGGSEYTSRENFTTPLVDMSSPDYSFGPIIVKGQEDFGQHPIPAATLAATANVMACNDFLWGTGEFQDPDGAAWGTTPQTVKLPTSTAQYGRTWINATLAPVTIQGPTGTGFTILPGKTVDAQCDGTNWNAKVYQ